MKRKTKRTWRATAGFTLVELVVVIAIMGILAGAGAAGYSGYVKNANKGADKTLVGNVIRAMETAALNPEFQNVTKLGSVEAVPVGFVILMEDQDVQTIAVDSEGTPISLDEKNGQVKREKFWTYDTSTGYWTSQDILYVVEGAQINRGTVKYYEWFQTKYADNQALLSGSKFVRADANSKTYSTSDSTLLSDTLGAAFGESYASDLRLKYSGWGSTGVEMDAYTDMQETWARFMSMLEVASYGIGDPNDWLNDTVDDLSEKNMLNEDGSLKLTQEEFLQYWLHPTDKNETFGFNKTPETSIKTLYTGCRMAWNTYFADYILEEDAAAVAAGETVAHKDGATSAVHAAYVSDYKDKNGGNALNNNYRVVTEGIITGTDQYSAFGAKGCERCKALHQAYMAENTPGGALYQSGVKYYQSLNMAARGSQDPGLAAVGYDYSKYMSDYMGQMDTVFSAAKASMESLDAAGKSYIVIAVKSNNGLIECEVFPSEANPRNDS